MSSSARPFAPAFARINNKKRIAFPNTLWSKMTGGSGNPTLTTTSRVALLQKDVEANNSCISSNVVLSNAHVLVAQKNPQQDPDKYHLLLLRVARSGNAKLLLFAFASSYSESLYSKPRLRSLCWVSRSCSSGLMNDLIAEFSILCARSLFRF